MTRTIELNVKEAQDIRMALTNEWAAAKKHLENIPLEIVAAPLTKRENSIFGSCSRR